MIFENLSFDVLIGRTFIDQCLHGIFSTSRKILFCHIKPGAIISTKTAIDVVKADNT